MVDAGLEAAIKGGRLTVHAHPDARKTAIREIRDGVVHLDVAAPPEDGKANAAIERFLSKVTGKTATIILGKTGKRKTVRLA